MQNLMHANFLSFDLKCSEVIGIDYGCMHFCDLNLEHMSACFMHWIALGIC